MKSVLYNALNWLWKRAYVLTCRHRYETLWFGKTGGVTLNRDYQYVPEYGCSQRCMRCGRMRQMRGSVRNGVVLGADEPNLATRLIATRRGELGSFPRMEPDEEER